MCYTFTTYHKKQKNMKKIILVVSALFLVGGVLWYTYQKQLPTVISHGHTMYLVNPGGPAYKSYFDNVESRLKELHHGDGADVQFYKKDAAGNPETLKTMISEAVQAKPDIIVTISSQPTQQAIKESNGQIPILSTLGDPVEHGYVDSLKGSGTNLGGVAQQNISLTPKRLELLKELVPTVKKVAIFYDTTCGPTKKAQPIADEVALQVGLDLVEIALTNPSRTDVEEALKKVTKQDYDALMFYPHGTLFSKADLFLKRALEEGLPIIMPNEESLTGGAIASYGPAYSEMGRLTARLAEKILTDRISIGELPWEQPNIIDFYISISNAEKLGVTISPDIANKAKLVR